MEEGNVKILMDELFKTPHVKSKLYNHFFNYNQVNFIKHNYA